MTELHRDDIDWGSPTRPPHARGATQCPRPRPVDDGWPRPLRSVAYVGVFGDIVKSIAPETEADPVALMLQVLAMFGNVIGRTAHFRAEADSHYFNLFSVLVGKTASGRKGVSEGRARALLSPIDEDWTRHCQGHGLSSGEGLIWQVRDDTAKGDDVMAGAADKRLLVTESEFASTLKVIDRQGNTLSPVVRNAWDRGDLRSMTKNSPAVATGAHISIIGHISRDELLRYLTRTEAANGFGNRFLWACVRRSRVLPDGGRPVSLSALSVQLRHAVEFARTVQEMRRDDEARTLWHQVYPRLTAERPGLFGGLTARAAPQTMRLACLFALGDMSSVVGEAHLRAALEVWRYCSQSVRYVFGNSLGDPTADEILRALHSRQDDGLTRSDILRDVFARNRPASEISRALAVLEDADIVFRHEETGTGGRNAERWFLAEDPYDRDDINDETVESPSTSVVNVVNVVDPRPGGDDADLDRF